MVLREYLRWFSLHLTLDLKQKVSSDSFDQNNLEGSSLHFPFEDCAFLKTEGDRLEGGPKPTLQSGYYMQS